MMKAILRISLLLIFVSAVYAGATGPEDETGTLAPAGNEANEPAGKEAGEPAGKEANEPAGKFVPSEKLKAGDSVDFPVDI